MASLLLLNRGHRVLTGNEIMEYLMPPVEQQIKNKVNNDPEAFSLTNASSMSDNFSFWDMTPDDLAAKGDGGMRTINNFYSVSQQDQINTPPDDYTPNKVNQGELDKFQEGRDTLINKPNPPKKVNFSD